MQGLLTLFSETTTYKPFQEELKEEKEKKKPKQPEEKAIPSGPWTSKLRHIGISATSSRRIDVSTTLFWRPTPAGMLLKKSQSPTAHDVLLTSMRRDLRRIDVDTTSFCHSNCLPCLSK